MEEILGNEKISGIGEDLINDRNFMDNYKKIRDNYDELKEKFSSGDISPEEFNNRVKNLVEDSQDFIDKVGTVIGDVIKLYDLSKEMIEMEKNGVSYKDFIVVNTLTIGCGIFVDYALNKTGLIDSVVAEAFHTSLLEMKETLYAGVSGNSKYREEYVNKHVDRFESGKNFSMIDALLAYFSNRSILGALEEIDGVEGINKSNGEYVTSWQLVRVDPIVLDLDGDGVEKTSVENGVHFDFSGDGFSEKTAWIGSDDGFLVYDKNEDGIINNASEMFGDMTTTEDGSLAKDGFEAMKDFDSNNDGKLSIEDEKFGKLKYGEIRITTELLKVMSYIA